MEIGPQTPAWWGTLKKLPFLNSGVEYREHGNVVLAVAFSLESTGMTSESITVTAVSSATANRL